jgi:hypothetical protein
MAAVNIRCLEEYRARRNSRIELRRPGPLASSPYVALGPAAIFHAMFRALALPVILQLSV